MHFSHRWLIDSWHVCHLCKKNLQDSDMHFARCELIDKWHASHISKNFTWYWHTFCTNMIDWWVTCPTPKKTYAWWCRACISHTEDWLTSDRPVTQAKSLLWGLGYINNRSRAWSHQSSKTNLHIYGIIPGNAHEAHNCQNTSALLSLGSILLQNSRWNWQSSSSPSLVPHWLPPKTRPNQQQRGLLLPKTSPKQHLRGRTSPNKHQRGRTSPNQHQRGRMTVSKLSRVGNRLMIVYHCDLHCLSRNDEQNNCAQCCMNLIFISMTPSTKPSYYFIFMA